MSGCHNRIFFVSSMSTKPNHVPKLSLAGVVITLGIVYGDIGTSPLYVLRAILSGLSEYRQEYILGALSCIIWTLTIQTTLKYIVLTLMADNRGEGGIFALFALIRRRAPWAYAFAIVGGSTLLADGIITPSITVTSAIEGLKIVAPTIPVLPIVIFIITALFLIQQFGTEFLGKFFGPVMLLWFGMLAVLGTIQIVQYPLIIKAFNPYYALKLLNEYPGGFVLLGAVFLATTGAEALYSDLGHCGKQNIRISWGFVKGSLILNYLGQGAWVLMHPEQIQPSTNPFFGVMPQWFLIPGIVMATAAAIIASQALLSGSFTLVSEAISLNFWPKLKLKYPTRLKGQIYIPKINWFLWASCMFVVLYFQESARMEAAYGLSITLTMIMTSVLLSIYFYKSWHVPLPILAWFMLVFLTVEGAFLLANLTKFMHGGWFSLAIAFVFILLMYVWHNGRKIKHDLSVFVSIKEYLPLLKAISQETTIPKYATHLVYYTKAGSPFEIEQKIIYSLIAKQPKRADFYWFVYVEVTDEPDTFEYKVYSHDQAPLIKVNFRLGFKQDLRIHDYFKQVVCDLSESKLIDGISPYPALRKFDIQADFQYILIDRIANYDYGFTAHQKFVMNLYDVAKNLGISEAKSLGLETSNYITERVPLMVDQPMEQRLKRVEFR